MDSFIIIAAYALQIVGAVFLLGGSFKKYRTYKDRQQAESIVEGLMEFINDSDIIVGSDLTEAAVGEASKAISFLEICFGYVLAIVAPQSQLSVFCQLIGVIVITVLIFALNRLLQKCVEKKFKKLYQEKKQKE